MKLEDPVSRTIELARLTLQEKGISYQAEAPDRLVIGYGSARLAIAVEAVGDSTVMRIAACVLDGVVLDEEAEFILLRALNDRNRTLQYGKFFFDGSRGEITVEYELLGDHLQDAEFLNAMTTVAEIADDHDDLLRGELSLGRRAVDREPGAGNPGK